MSRHANRPSPGRWALAALALLGGLAATTTGVYAGLNAEATGTSAVSTGTLLMTLGADGTSGGLPMTVSAMVPGDTDNVAVNLTNTGTVASAAGMTLAASPSVSNLLTTSATKGLQLAVTECSVAWSAGACTGTATPILAATPVATIVSAGSTGVALTNVPALAAGAALAHLQFSLSLPNQSETTVNGQLPAAGTTIQGLSTTLTWTFTEQQRAGTVTNS